MRSAAPARVDRDTRIARGAEMSERAERHPDLRHAREEVAERHGRPAVGALHPANDGAGARERSEIRPHAVHVLVDPELLLTGLLWILRASADTANSLVQPGDGSARPGHASHLAHHLVQVERVMQG